MRLLRFVFVLVALLSGWLPMPSAEALQAAFPVTVTDSFQNRASFSAPPRRVVSLAPYVTEMLLAFDQEAALVGLTRQDLVLQSALRKKNVGNYFNPDMAAVAECRPDLVIAAPSHADLVDRLRGGGRKVLILEARTLEDAFDQMAMIGRLFACEARSRTVIQRNRDQLAMVAARLAGIPTHQRKRVVRVMAGEGLACPGDDSFQNEMIVAAGGIAPQWGRTGFAVPVTPAAWQAFDPQVIYGCHDNGTQVRAVLEQDGWRDVTAVRTGAVTMFPCALTCQASTRIGAFVQWLAASLYLDRFSHPEKAVLKDAVLGRQPVAVDLDYVVQGQVVTHRVADAHYKSLVVTFKRPQEVLSTLEGGRSGVRAVGNTYVPMHASLGHMANGIDQVQEAVANNLGFSRDAYAGLMTGAHMDNLAVRTENFKDLRVTVLVTAGVKGNAMRMSKDEGAYYKPGTINIIVMTNRRLSPAAMALAIITATEAKTAALLDMDIRSSYTPLDHRATGTGTDNIILVQGEGAVARYTGGHTKIGELIARAVYAGVTAAVFKQNGLGADRDLFQRLADRKLSLEQMVACYPVRKMDPRRLVSRLEEVLSDPYYAAFFAAALAVSDDYQKGLIKELLFFDAMCGAVTAKLSGRTDLPPLDVTKIALPPVVARAFGALLNGAVNRDE